jgi:hypothetical protein
VLANSIKEKEPCMEPPLFQSLGAMTLLPFKAANKQTKVVADQRCGAALQTSGSILFPCTTINEQLDRFKHRPASPTYSPKPHNSPSSEDSSVMKPEALDAFATQSIRPGALEAATVNRKNTSKSETPNMEEGKRDVSLSAALLLQ